MICDIFCGAEPSPRNAGRAMGSWRRPTPEISTRNCASAGTAGAAASKANTLRREVATTLKERTGECTEEREVSVMNIRSKEACKPLPPNMVHIVIASAAQHPGQTRIQLHPDPKKSRVTT